LYEKVSNHKIAIKLAYFCIIGLTIVFYLDLDVYVAGPVTAYGATEERVIGTDSELS
jgi:hypothetical protein